MREAWEEGKLIRLAEVLPSRAPGSSFPTYSCVYQANISISILAGVNTDQLHLGPLVKLNDPKPHTKSPNDSPLSPDFIPSTTYAYELFSVTSTRLDDVMASDWPEKDERADRKWVKGWNALEEAVVWGRRSEINRDAVRLLKERLS